MTPEYRVMTVRFLMRDRARFNGPVLHCHRAAQHVADQQRAIMSWAGFRGRKRHFYFKPMESFPAVPVYPGEPIQRYCITDNVSRAELQEGLRGLPKAR